MKKAFPSVIMTSSAVIPFCMSIERGRDSDINRPATPFTVPINVIMDRPVNSRYSHALATILGSSEQLAANQKTIVEMTVSPAGISYAETPNNGGKTAYLENNTDIILPFVVSPKSSARWYKIKTIYPQCTPILVPDRRQNEFSHMGIKKPTAERPDSLLSPYGDFNYHSMTSVSPDSNIYPGSCVETGEGSFIIMCLHIAHYHMFIDRFGNQERVERPYYEGHDFFTAPFVGGVTDNNQVLYPKQGEGSFYVYNSTDLKLAYTYEITVTKRVGQDWRGIDYRQIYFECDERVYGIDGMPHIYSYGGDIVMVENTRINNENPPLWEEVTEDYFYLKSHGVFLEEEETVFGYKYKPAIYSPFLPFFPILLPKIGSGIPAFLGGFSLSSLSNIRTNIKEK